MTLEAAKKKYLNERGLMCCGIGTLRFDVDILEVRKKFGRIDLHVAPANGDGKGWISSKFVDMPKKPKR